MSAPTDGMLMDVCVSEGQHVKAGEVLAVIDNRVAQASVQAARAAADRSGERQHAIEELKFAQEVYDRQLSLQAAQNGSDFELLEALTRLEKAKATIITVDQEETRAKLLLQLELARLETHNIRAPFSGQIVQIHAQPGATLTRDDDLLTIVCVAELKADLYVSLDRYGQLRIGNDYPLQAGPPVNRVVTARLQFVAPVIDAASNTCRATFTMENSDQHLPAGFSVYLDTAWESTVPAPPSTP
jgi:cobalt-zinc-cadmium efflux system membrane fusion protein